MLRLMHMAQSSFSVPEVLVFVRRAEYMFIGESILDGWVDGDTHVLIISQILISGLSYQTYRSSKTDLHVCRENYHGCWKTNNKKDRCK